MPNTEHRPTERVLDILELLAATPAGLSLSDIAKHIGSPKTTVVPILHTMASRKFIIFHQDSGLYTTGIGTYLAGSSYTGDKNVMEFIRSEMEKTVSEINETCQFGIRSDGDVLYIAKVDSKEAIRLVSSVGKRLPLYCTALGKALLYGTPFEMVKELYPDGLKPMTPHTICDFDCLERELARVNENRFASEKEETTPQVCCYAVPICRNRKTIASISVSVPAYRDTQEKAVQIETVLRKTGAVIEKFLSERQIDEHAFYFYEK